MSIKVYVAELVFGGLLTVGCGMDIKNDTKSTETKYFATFSGYNIPLKLTEEIPKELALKRDAYYVGFYDEDQRLTCVEKYLDGALFFRHSYFYREDGSLRESKTVNSEGIETVSYFDENGRKIDE